MSSITIEVDDPATAYENVLELFEAAPVDFSQVTSVRLEIEYESEDGAEPAESDAEPGIGARDDESNPSIADAEGGTVAPAFDTDGDDTPADGFGAISFDDADDSDADDDPFGDAVGPDSDESIFDADAEPATDGHDQQAGESIFAETADEGSTTTDDGDSAGIGQTADADGLNGVTFEDPMRETTDATAEPVVQDAETDRTAGDQPTPSPRTYNKVMRLLQNRDFPIERAQIESVAAGAYDVDPEECRAIVDAAIEKGLVAQDGPKLIDPTE
ncbi:hypothetical protein [Haloarchaeobius amylolyticus]|uniref:hypothetical protein n=1 Tax=Haloarchaeobius amylolyticus TaxID=1198296 RepID=UPI0022715E7E|nr:hypothetical protein [Haloarchaeobius amylolyticus]